LRRATSPRFPCTTLFRSSILEQALRDDLDPKAERLVAVLDPVKLVITNYPEGQTELCQAPRNPHDPEAGMREFPFSRELLIERRSEEHTSDSSHVKISYA